MTRCGTVALPEGAPVEGTSQRTIWRGLGIDHPPDWEVALVSGPGVGRLCFVDRRHQRMDVQWRKLRGEIDPELVLAKHRPGGDQHGTAKPLRGTPAGWRGIVVGGTTPRRVHALRQWPGTHLLVEVSILWPDAAQRDKALERRLLSSARPEEPSQGMRLWQVFGLSVRAPEQWELTRCDSTVGRVVWHFRPVEAKELSAAVARQALVETLGRKSPQQWLVEQLPPGSQVLHKRSRLYGQHGAGEVLSRQRKGRLHSLLRGRTIQRDVAWVCPTEQRLYRLTVRRRTREDDAELPDALRVNCCRPVPPVAAGERMGA